LKLSNTPQPSSGRLFSYEYKDVYTISLKVIDAKGKQIGSSRHHTPVIVASLMYFASLGKLISGTTESTSEKLFTIPVESADHRTPLRVQAKVLPYLSFAKLIVNS